MMLRSTTEPACLQPMGRVHSTICQGLSLWPRLVLQRLPKWGRAVLLLGAGTTIVLGGCSRDLEAIVDANTTAMGGRDRLERLHSLVVVNGPRAAATLQFPDRIKVEIFDSLGALLYAEGYDGSTAWEQEQKDSARRPVSGPPRAALFHASQWPTNLIPLFRMTERGHDLRLVGRLRIGTTDYWQVRLTLSDGFARDYFINPAHGRIERARDVRELHALDGKTREIETVFRDYREVDGVWFAFTIEEYDLATGEKLSGDTRLAILPDRTIPDGAFAASGRSSSGWLRALVDSVRGAR